jgi:hypothetical protein
MHMQKDAREVRAVDGDEAREFTHPRGRAKRAAVSKVEVREAEERLPIKWSGGTER